MRTRLRVKEVAEKQGLSMTKLHQRSEVAYGTIRKIFRDPFTVVNLDTLTRLAETLKVEINELVESVPDEPDNGATP
jgi:DNA-binding Xre family transcriptional regulator